MCRLAAPAALFASLALALALLVPGVRADETGRHPACIEVRGEARYGAQGYDHHVLVRNGCDREARCSVTTDVNPQPAPLTVAPGATGHVVMWRGSPARVFAPRADCTLVGAPPTDTDTP